MVIQEGEIKATQPLPWNFNIAPSHVHALALCCTNPGIMIENRVVPILLCTREVKDASPGLLDFKPQEWLRPEESRRALLNRRASVMIKIARETRFPYLQPSFVGGMQITKRGPLLRLPKVAGTVHAAYGTVCTDVQTISRACRVNNGESLLAD